MKTYVRDRQCDICGKMDTVRKDNKATTCGACSRKAAARKSAKIKSEAAKATRKPCEFCGKMVNSSVARFCSVHCKSESARVMRECKTCGNDFSVLRSSISGRTNASGNFCSRPCYEKYLCNGSRTTGRGSQWSRIRADVLRAFPFCASCGTTKNLQVHHIIPFRLTHDNSKENLVPLCVKHHRWIETMFVETERFGVDETNGLIWRNMIRSMQAVTAYRIKEVARATA